MTQLFINIIATSKVAVFLLALIIHILVLFFVILSEPKQNYQLVDNEIIRLTSIGRLKPSMIETTKPPSPNEPIRKDKKIKKNKIISKKKFLKTVETADLKKVPLIPKVKETSVLKKEEMISNTEETFIIDNDEILTQPKLNNSDFEAVEPLKSVKTGARIGGDIKLCKPAYPRVSKRRGEEGTVILRFLINENGMAEKAEIKKSSGYKRLDNAAKLGLLSCKFLPATKNGVFVKDWAVIPYVFQLK
ncbi:MAG: hypothetical protein CBD16_06030 [Betaproteobacteria bacterium TMED156]|nr:MAG: hypothetical protein CBD16_06030 [Betaproteobacteria bacterium TMED156]|tara:strand:+ start:44 stop:784 length:741 start_codon:yes stop_codon:yes gene_type:complete